MKNSRSEITDGVKTFFVTPDLAVFPEDLLPTFFLHGYESYFLHDDPYCSLESKIHLLFSVFSEVIIFFNIDRVIQGIDWPYFLSCLQLKYGERVHIGVMYQKRSDDTERHELEKLYLYELGLVSGCIPMEYQKNRNRDQFLGILSANQANGRRKNIRILCNNRYKMNMRYMGREYQAELRDVSVNHFSCIFLGMEPDIQLHQKFVDIQLNLHGILCSVDAVMCLKRVTDDDVIYVFVFRDRKDREGLNPDVQERVNNIVFTYMQTTVHQSLKDVFAAERLRRMQLKAVHPERKSNSIPYLQSSPI